MNRDQKQDDKFELGEFPFPLTDGPQEPRYLTWLRNHSNYMAVRGLFDYLRSVGVLVRGIVVNFLILLPLLLLVSIGLGFAHHWMLAHPFGLTAWVMLIALSWVLIFPLVMPLYKIISHRRSLETGSESSIQARDRYERSFGALLFAFVISAILETMPWALELLHELVHSERFGWTGVLASLGAAVVFLSGSDKLGKLLTGYKKKIAMTLLGVLGLLVPFLVVIFAAEFIVYGRPRTPSEMISPLFIPLVGALGLLIAIPVGLRRGAIGWKGALKLTGIIVGALALAGSLTVGGGWARKPGEGGLAELQEIIKPFQRVAAEIHGIAADPEVKLEDDVSALVNELVSVQRDHVVAEDDIQEQLDKLKIQAHRIEERFKHSKNQWWLGRWAGHVEHDWKTWINRDRVAELEGEYFKSGQQFVKLGDEFAALPRGRLEPLRREVVKRAHAKLIDALEVRIKPDLARSSTRQARAGRGPLSILGQFHDYVDEAAQRTADKAAKRLRVKLVALYFDEIIASEDEWGPDIAVGLNENVDDLHSKAADLDTQVDKLILKATRLARHDLEKWNVVDLTKLAGKVQLAEKVIEKSNLSTSSTKNTELGRLSLKSKEEIAAMITKEEMVNHMFKREYIFKALGDRSDQLLELAKESLMEAALPRVREMPTKVDALVLAKLIVQVTAAAAKAEENARAESATAKAKAKLKQDAETAASEAAEQAAAAFKVAGKAREKTMKQAAVVADGAAIAAVLQAEEASKEVESAEEAAKAAEEALKKAVEAAKATTAPNVGTVDPPNEVGTPESVDAALPPTVTQKIQQLRAEVEATVREAQIAKEKEARAQTIAEKAEEAAAKAAIEASAAATPERGIASTAVMDATADKMAADEMLRKAAVATATTEQELKDFAQAAAAWVAAAEAAKKAAESGAEKAAAVKEALDDAVEAARDAAKARAVVAYTGLRARVSRDKFAELAIANFNANQLKAALLRWDRKTFKVPDETSKLWEAEAFGRQWVKDLEFAKNLSLLNLAGKAFEISSDQKETAKQQTGVTGELANQLSRLDFYRVLLAEKVLGENENTLLKDKAALEVQREGREKEKAALNARTTSLNVHKKSLQDNKAALKENKEAQDIIDKALLNIRKRRARLAREKLVEVALGLGVGSDNLVVSEEAKRAQVVLGQLTGEDVEDGEGSLEHPFDASELEHMGAYRFKDPDSTSLDDLVATLMYGKHGPLDRVSLKSPKADLTEAVIFPKVVFILLLALVIGIGCWVTVDVNQTSVHGLYRDRLASAFLIGKDDKGDVKIEEDINLGDICRYDAGSIAPYHLINVALNLQGSKDVGIRDRNSDFFIFSKRFIGGDRTGYCRSVTMENVFPQTSLATAMAVSAAAASPNMGRGTSPLLVAFMSLLNIRLGFWMPNPGLLEERQDEQRWKEKKEQAKSRGEELGPALGYKFNEVFATELKDIESRWRQVYRAPADTPRSLVKDLKTPSVRHGLVGMGFSGGGIRSAAINLGIVQALEKAGVFAHLDYVSSVSGGGYLASSLSTLMRTRESLKTEGDGTINIEEDKNGLDKIVTVTRRPPRSKPSSSPDHQSQESESSRGLASSGEGESPAVKELPAEESKVPRVMTYRYARDAELEVHQGQNVGAGQMLVRRSPAYRSETKGSVRVDPPKDGQRKVVVAECKINEDQEAATHTYSFSRFENLTVKSGDFVQADDPLISVSNTLRDRFKWRVRPTAFLWEMVSKLDERSRWVNLSDGGHIENLATMELLRRRCEFIIIGDGEADPTLSFNGLALLIRTARIDLGIQIEINVDEIRECRKSPGLGTETEQDDRTNRGQHWAIGTINYPITKENPEGETGVLLYLKSAFTGDENEVIKEYRCRKPDFPHETTADQMFDEGQFEAYRALGQHTAEQALEAGTSLVNKGEWKKDAKKLTFSGVQDWFTVLAKRKGVTWIPREKKVVAAKKTTTKKTTAKKTTAKKTTAKKTTAKKTTTKKTTAKKTTAKKTTAKKTTAKKATTKKTARKRGSRE